MKNYFIALFVLLTFGVLIYEVPSFRAKVVSLLSYSQCNSPLQYKIGSIDPRFGLTSQDVLQDAVGATSIWDSAEGKNLFTYSQNATLTLNFVYDQRQALDNTISQLNSQLDQNNQTLTQQINQFKLDEAAFQQELDSFNAKIEKYNQQGGVPQDVYPALLKEQQDLNAQAKTLNVRAQQLNLSTSQYNQNVSVLNNDVHTFHNVLAQKPEEGLYDGNTNTITIYIINNHDELIHTLAHEFGHALGMQHVPDAKAIMYAYTTQSLSTTPDDLQQLQFVCRQQSLVIYYLQQFDLWLFTKVQSLRQLFTK